MAWNPLSSFLLKFDTVILSPNWKKKKKGWSEQIFKENSVFSNNVQNGAKWCFLHFLKILPLAFPGNNLNWEIKLVFVSPHVYYLVKLWFSSYGPKYSWTIRLQDSLKCNSTRKKRDDKLIFCIQIKIEVFYKLMLLFFEAYDQTCPKFSR